MVELPKAITPLAGQDVVVVRADGEVQVLPGVRWAAPAPQLLHDLIARQLELAGSAPSVAKSAQAYIQPLRLAIDLTAFELRDDQGALSAHAAVTLTLVCTRDARVIAASPPLSVDAAPVPTQPAAATAALRGAAGVLARQIVFWLDKVDASSCAVD
jgi:cholesterol transport system auxiliary component